MLLLYVQASFCLLLRYRWSVRAPYYIEQANTIQIMVLVSLRVRSVKSSRVLQNRQLVHERNLNNIASFNVLT